MQAQPCVMCFINSRADTEWQPVHKQAQCTAWAQKINLLPKTNLPSWVSEWRGCSLGTITRGEASLLGKFLSGLRWKWKGEGEKEEEEEGENYSLVIFSQGLEEFLCVFKD